MITLKEIARQCGVSMATVSNVLSGKPKVGEDTRKRVLEKIREVGYQPNYFAQSMRRKKRQTIGIITEDIAEFSTPPIVENIMAYCEEHNYKTVLINLRLYDRWKNTWYCDKERIESVLIPAIQELMSIKVDGIMYVAGHCRRIDYFPDNPGIPAIIVYAVSGNGSLPSVCIDDEKGGYDVTKYLLTMGHRRIGVIAGVEDNSHTQDRSRGYRKALDEAGIPFRPELVRYGDWSRKSAYNPTIELLKKDVTAIFCMNDRMAAGAYEACYDNNVIVGADISIAGYDNMHMCDYLRPGLTTNEIPFSEIGRKASEIFLEKLEKEEHELKPEIIRIPCNLTVRASVVKV